MRAKCATLKYLLVPDGIPVRHANFGLAAAACSDSHSLVVGWATEHEDLLVIRLVIFLSCRPS